MLMAMAMAMVMVMKTPTSSIAVGHGLIDSLRGWSDPSIWTERCPPHTRLLQGATLCPTFLAFLLASNSTHWSDQDASAPS
jgi:hypothetical protein